MEEKLDLETLQKGLDVLKEFDNHNKELNDSALAHIKELINYPFNLIEESLNDLCFWQHQKYVEIELSDYKCGSYPSYDFYTIKGEPDGRKYMRQDDDGEYHNLVWQITGCCEDEYSGYQLFPLNDGTYWMIYYEC